ncbi:hypothetical protein ACWEVM_04355 [Streptomyces bauhiniae]|uniref:hypothetical protein n=1 Tax=Streptomyces bauhiniae TaxID=2340725 RepID=UPI003683DBDC
MSDVLLALDFPGRRDEARIADLRLEEAGWKVEYALAPPYSRVPDAGAQAAALAARRTGGAPRAVLAYCMAAPLAHELAALLSPAGEPVPLLLFDGEPGRPEAVRDAARTVAGQLTGGAAQTLDGDPELLSDAALAGRPAEVMAAVEDRMNRLAAAVFREDGFDETEARAAATQVSGFYLDWIAHLTASLHTTRPSWGGRVQHIRTPGHPGPRVWPGAGATENHVVDSGRNDLLRDPRTRELALTLLGPPTA